MYTEFKISEFANIIARAARDTGKTDEEAGRQAKKDAFEVASRVEGGFSMPEERQFVEAVKGYRKGGMTK